MTGTPAHPAQRLLTYAIKDTVSVLYWYEKLSIYGKFFDKIFESFFFLSFFFICLWGGAGVLLAARRSTVAADFGMANNKNIPPDTAILG